MPKSSKIVLLAVSVALVLMIFVGVNSSGVRHDPMQSIPVRLDNQAPTVELATVPFTPPAVGQWRANATYEGSRTASPSAVGFTYLLVS